MATMISVGILGFSTAANLQIRWPKKKRVSVRPPYGMASEYPVILRNERQKTPGIYICQGLVFYPIGGVPMSERDPLWLLFKQFQGSVHHRVLAGSNIGLLDHDLFVRR